MKRIITLELLIACCMVTGTVSAAGRVEFEDRMNTSIQGQGIQPRRDLTQAEKNEAYNITQEVHAITSKLPRDRFSPRSRARSSSVSSGSVTPTSAVPDEGVFIESPRPSEPLSTKEAVAIKAEATRHEVRDDGSAPIPIDERVAHEMKWYTNLVTTTELFDNLSPAQREKLLQDIADTTPDEAGIKHLEQTIERAKQLVFDNRYSKKK